MLNHEPSEIDIELQLRIDQQHNYMRTFPDPFDVGRDEVMAAWIELKRLRGIQSRARDQSRLVVTAGSDSECIGAGLSTLEQA